MLDAATEGYVYPFAKSLPKRRFRMWGTRLLAAAGLAASLCSVGDVRATPATFTFPGPNPGWVIARNGGLPIVDTEGDAPTARDIVGDATHPALFIASDATHLYFRLRLDVDPRQNATNIGPFGWGCLINTDSDLTTYEYSTIVDGVNNPDSIYFYKNTTTSTVNSPADAPDLPPITIVGDPLTMAVGHAQVVPVTPGSFGDNGNVDNDFFMDWAIELAPAMLAGFNPANPANYYCGSANNGTNIGTDCTGTLPNGTGCGPLNVIFTDPIACGPLGCAICGDGQKGAAEGCDDGNRLDGDGCNSVCLLELGRPCAGVNSGCASGFCDPTGNICACDANADCPMGKLCSVAPNPNICVDPGCGNAIVEAGEGCDDGNTSGGDGCNAVCLKEIGQTCGANVVCASGYCDPDGSICACDQNADCPLPNVCNVIATPNACVAPGCGNQVVETGEGCDDGNTSNGDGCNNNCLREIGEPCAGANNVCASGFCDPAGNLCQCNEDTDCPGGFSCDVGLTPNQCVPTGCGDGSEGVGEGCDDGNLNNGDGCNAQCLKELGQPCTTGPVCASGFCDAMICACNENVDCPGVQLCNTSANPNACVNPGCGNHVLELNEGCDDGNTVSNDGCTSACLLELGEACTASSACASGACAAIDAICVCDENADCPTGTPVCKLAADPNLCVVAGCGNGVLEMGEACDDDNTTNGDGCNGGCLLEIGQSCPGGSNTCASGFCDPVGTVCACDTNADCFMGQLCNLLAAPNLCVNPGCGNGVVESSEACDDNNMTDGDGCTGACLLEMGRSCPGGSMTCASGFCDSADTTCACDENADCPSGQVCNTVASPNVCVNPGCGNGVREGVEGCDDGNTTAGDGCDGACLLELGLTCGTNSECASGVCEMNVCVCAQDSDCAMGDVCNTSATPNACVAAGCGNGVVEANEGCDDGNIKDGDGCNAACVKELGETCTNNMECGSGNCDGTMNQCVCDKNSDCPTDQICDTMTVPHACVMPPKSGCQTDTDCTGGLLCDELSGKCVVCTQDSDCKEGTCLLDTGTCKPNGVLLEGTGITCTVSSTPMGGDNLPMGLLGLLGLGALRRRRR